ncbi:arsenate reductase/protein-tyrosine-phosphatase family protein [Streptomyces olivochromogenes]|uniref:arsenate reductase/protein-tyrosine-phosphatase family protein n=1 Tax=Streptomyces olivochromogenes TaxID=1963 RepID=UPI001F3C8CCC|nr:low molecular weight phosphatase family protein [Streptomyces olivochromogenes]MCF3130197.1 low molecular weight phosphatase family protein [Streptomyces olivochromogenes]
MTRVLFVCTGNVHRSVLAERLLAARLPPDSAVWPESAGTEAWARAGMESSTRAVLEKLGGDGSGFAARPLTAQLVAGAALVLGLAREHREAAVRLAPSSMRRCFTLKEFVRLAAGGVGQVQGGKGAATAYGGEPDGEGPRVVDSVDVVVAAAAGRRGTAAPVPSAEDDVADPWGSPDLVLYGCAREIDGAVSTLARLLGGGTCV